MNNLQYASRQVFKPKMANFVKVITLTFGLSFGAMMFTAIAFNYTFDTFFKDSNRICIVYADYINGGQHSRENFAFAPAPLAPVAEAEMTGVECATRFYGPNGKGVRREDSDKTYGLNIINADKNYFKVFDLPIMAGDTSTFSEPGSLFISEREAVEIFSTLDVLGKTLIDDDGNSYTIRGIFERFPYNTSWFIEAVSFAKEEDFSEDWLENHWCNTFFKLTPGTTIKSIEKQFASVQERHYDVSGYKAKGQYVNLSATFLRWHHNKQGSAFSANVIVFILGLVILLISGLNYVLLAVSSINSRSKEIGVHKCNGASRRSIFALVMDETLIYIILAIVLTAALIIASRGVFETMTSAPLKDIFSFENLYAVGITILSLLLVAGLIPANVFSSIPVKQVFLQQSEKRTPWKKALLFAQLFATVYVLCFLMIVVLQNDVLFKTSHGVNMEPLVVSVMYDVSEEKAETVRDVLGGDENVRQVSISSSFPLDYPWMNNVMEAGTGTSLFSSGYFEADENFLDTYDVPLLYGTFIKDATDTNTVVVNEKFVSMMDLTPSEALGKKFVYNNKTLSISGVVKDFHLCNFKIKEQFALIISGFGRYNPLSKDGIDLHRTVKITLALNEVTADAMASLNHQIEEMIPINSPKVVTYKDVLFESYQGEVVQKKLVSLAAVIILFLSFIGVISYVSAEVSRRKREIAIRRIQGSTISEVLKLISKGVIYTTIAASALAVGLCLYVGHFWQQDFYIKAPLSPWIFIGVTLFVIILVTITTIVQSIKIVSANPADVMRNSAQ